MAKDALRCFLESALKTGEPISKLGQQVDLTIAIEAG
jgi:hypothetical protein